MSLRNAKQYFCDCYLVASLNAFTRCANGRRLLGRNIKIGEDGFQITFNNVNGRQEDYFVTQEEIEKLVLLDKFMNIVKFSTPHHPIVKAVEVAMNKLISANPSAKPFWCRCASCDEKFEYNKPSNFMEMFSGVVPIAVNEDSFRMTMKSKKDELFEIFENIDKMLGSFVLGTGYTSSSFASWHCFTVEGVNKENRYVDFVENRHQKSFRMDFDNIAKQFKFIVGYYDRMLKDR